MINHVEHAEMPYTIYTFHTAKTYTAKKDR